MAPRVYLPARRSSTSGLFGSIIRPLLARVRFRDRSLHFATMFLLLTSALIPFPTAVLSAALLNNNPFDASVVTLYGGLGRVMCFSWLILFHMLSVHRYLLEDNVDQSFFRKRAIARALVGVA